MKKKPIQDRWPEDEDAGLDTFREHMGGHPEPTEQLARTWFALLEQVERNLDGGEPDGLRDARRMLLQALRFTYPFATRHRLSDRHNRLPLSAYVLTDGEAEPF